MAMAATRCGIFASRARLVTGAEGLLEDAEEFVHDFALVPKELLQALHPLEVGDDDAAGVAEDVGDDEDVVPALEEDAVGGGRGGAIGGFGEDAAAELGGVLLGDDAFDGGGHEDIAREGEEVVGRGWDRLR